ncbi:MAG: glycogen/starch synthase [Flavobacteriaceae bacterium]
MTGKRVLYVSSEVVPYLPESKLSNMSFEAPKMVNDRGGQTRIFIPKYGMINERRHQLHEVIRLSGMNLVINDIDMPLIIKVASIPKERMQVYFIDNEDYFKGRRMAEDEDGNLYPDNDERAIFFAKGVIETVKKLNWAPDIIHVQGWISLLMPLYCKKYYADDPLLANTKIVTSFFGTPFEQSLSKDLVSKIAFDGIDSENLNGLSNPNYMALAQSAVVHSDGIIIADNDIAPNLKKTILDSGKPTMSFVQDHNFEDNYESFYMNQILS